MAVLDTSDQQTTVLLISTYEMGRQPFGLASPAAWLGARGASVTVKDLSVEDVSDVTLAASGVVAFYLPMHTATRLAAPLIERTRRVNPNAVIAAYGIYAPLNDGYLKQLGVDHVFGGEFEEGLSAVVEGREPEEGRKRTRFIVPERNDLPALSNYARLRFPDGETRVVGYTEASRGCKHECRHCPVVPIYQGSFNIVPPEVVLDDISNQVAIGAEHITFGDPDFFNGPAHAVRVIEGMKGRHPDVTYDAVIKVEHLKQRADLVPWLADTGCAFVTTAVESFDDRLLTILDKGHTAADFEDVLASARASGLPIAPTFLAFTPWTTIESYGAFLETIEQLGLVSAVSPIQYAIRLLLPEGSLLLSHPDVEAITGSFDSESLAYQWTHSDPRVDSLQEDLLKLISHGHDGSRADIFERAWALAAEHGAVERRESPWSADVQGLATIPYLTEPWYC